MLCMQITSSELSVRDYRAAKVVGVEESNSALCATARATYQIRGTSILPILGREECASAAMAAG